jgi:multiple RNA-binding domain-containing protein 1
MSRICVKNLPKHVSEDRIRDFFSQKGEVTDAKHIRTKDGKSRQFGFVGFRSEGEAEEALKFFNDSYMDTCKITCEIARKVGDPEIPRPWSRHTLKKQVNMVEEKIKTDNPTKLTLKKKGDKRENDDDDAQLQDFLQVMQPRVKSKLWSNDTAAPPVDFVKGNKKGKTKKNSGTTVDLKADDEERENGSVESDESPKHKKNEAVSDMDYFKSRVKKNLSDNDDDDEDDTDDGDDEDDTDDGDDDDNDDVSDDVKKTERAGSEEAVEEESSVESDDDKKGTGDTSAKLEDENQVLETGRLFIRNLPYTATEDELAEHFSRFGNISQVHLVIDKDTKRSKGFAYVLYATPESAARVLRELDNSIFQGRLLHIMPAQQKNPTVEPEINNSSSNSSKTFKQKRVEERKASEASGNTRSWNTLFMRPDTVVENIARKFGVSKSDLLDREADDLAVRIALGETQVVSETKKALANAGVDVGLLEQFASGKTDDIKRSNHIILVKNLPYGSSESELATMFAKFGSLDKIILPPTKTMALVAFLEPAEARAAFRGLSYKRYKDAPLYLEWAPNNVINKAMKVDGNLKNTPIVDEDVVKRVLLEQHVEGIANDDVDLDRVESRSLFVKNLNFKTSDENLRKHFCDHMKEGKLISVRVKKHVKNGKNVSMGFGFVEFDSVDNATNVCRDLQGTVLDGHALILQLCHGKNKQVPKRADEDQSSTKLIVRNVAFEATEKELRQLFSPFGQLKSLRLPMRFGNHRGFAFVEYMTKQEAQNALQSLSNTHLYGRHLVLERAKEGESLEELRERTAAQFTDEQNGFQNLSKKRKGTSLLDETSVKFKRITE